MIVDDKVRQRINWFIYAYETSDVNEISSHLLDVPTRVIEAVLEEPFTRMSELDSS